MRQSIRALGWTTTISMLLLFAFLATSVYSMIQTVLINQGIGIGGEPQISFFNETLTLSFPLSVNNTGYYDMSELNVTTVLLGPQGGVISRASTFVERVPRGSAITREHNMSLSLTDILSYVTDLTQDTELNMSLSLGLRYAEALAFQVAMMNLSIRWGAPLYNFSITEVRPFFNGTHYLLEAFVEFENHAFFDVEGTVHINVYNDKGEYIGSGDKTIHVQAGYGYSDFIEVVIEDPLKFTEQGYVEISFESPIFGHFDLGRIYYG